MSETEHEIQRERLRRLAAGTQWTRRQQEELKNRRSVFRLNSIKTNPKGPMSDG